MNRPVSIDFIPRHLVTRNEIDGQASTIYLKNQAINGRLSRTVVDVHHAVRNFMKLCKFKKHAFSVGHYSEEHGKYE